MRLPNKPTGDHPFVAWACNLIDWIASERLTAVVGGKLTQTTAGRVLTIDENAGGGIREAFHPFKVYASPANADGEIDAMKVRVRAGKFWNINVTGTDGANEDPDDATNIPAYDATNIEITVEPFTGLDKFYIWLHRVSNTVVSVAGYYNPAIGPTSALKWSTYPEPDNKNIPIAEITVNADNTLTIRQYLRTDVLFLCPPPTI